MTQKHYTAVKHWYPLLFGRFILLDFSLVFFPEMSVSQPFPEGSASYGSHWMSTGGLSQVQTTLQPPSPSSRTPPHRQRRLAEVIKSRTTSQAHIAHLMIPAHLSNLIWEAITDVPNIAAGRAQLHEVFTQPPTYEDYLACQASRIGTWKPSLKTYTSQPIKCYVPMANPAYTGFLETTLACPTAQNDWTL